MPQRFYYFLSFTVFVSRSLRRCRCVTPTDRSITEHRCLIQLVQGRFGRRKPSFCRLVVELGNLAGTNRCLFIKMHLCLAGTLQDGIELVFLDIDHYFLIFEVLHYWILVRIISYKVHAEWDEARCNQEENHQVVCYLKEHGPVVEFQTVPIATRTPLPATLVRFVLKDYNWCSIFVQPHY